MNSFEINGFYGHTMPTPSTVFVVENRNGSKWYCVEGSQMVNKTYDDIENGQNVEELSDFDCFTWPKPIESLDELIEAIES
jgi:hypothetical protein